MIDSIIENAHQLDFYKAVFVIENQLKCADSDYRHVGYDSHPKMELVKFSSVQKLGFQVTLFLKLSRMDTVIIFIKLQCIYLLWGLQAAQVRYHNFTLNSYYSALNIKILRCVISMTCLIID